MWWKKYGRGWPPCSIDRNYVATQGGHDHIGPLLKLGNRRLLHMQHFGQHLLRQVTGLAQLLGWHFSQLPIPVQRDR